MLWQGRQGTVLGCGTCSSTCLRGNVLHMLLLLCAQAQAGTANLTPHNDIALLANMTTHSADSGGLAAVGLELADDNDMMFEDI